MWGQRAAEADPLFWDYHVVALLPQLGIVVDLDDRDAVAWPVASWLEHAFGPLTVPALRPLFRVVDEESLRATFSTDRSHMLSPDGTAGRPLPPWSPPWQASLGMTLPRFLAPKDDIAGVVVDDQGFLSLCAPFVTHEGSR